jgi:hypothetical protein
MTHLSDDDLVLHFYGEADAPAGAREHLSACDACRRRFLDLERVMLSIDDNAVPERDESYGRQVWARLQPALDAERSRKRSWFGGWLTFPRLAAAGALASLLIVAFVAGRYSRLPGDPVPGAASGNGGPQRILLIAVSDHLERSAMVLAEISNLDGGPLVDISAEQTAAADLVASNRLYRQVALRNTDDAGLARVLEDLERVLIEIANSPSTVPAEELDQIRARIESQGLLFKVRVLGSKAKQDAAAPRPQASS